MEMKCPTSAILACQVLECSYNENHECHAGSIEVGDRHPSCDTFTTAPVEQMPGDPQVTTCHIGECKYHGMGDSCQAAGVSLGYHSHHADCDTYVPEG